MAAVHTPRRAAFTLIELIGVLAIIAIMASVLAPNALRSIDRAAVRAERDNTARLSEQVALHLRDLRTLPPEATWYTALAGYSDLAGEEIRLNSRGTQRLFVYETTTNPERALILSSMRSGCNLPNTVALARTQFATIWDNKDVDVPFLLGWTGWRRTIDGAGNVVATDGDHLVVERINLRPLLRGELQPRTISLNNVSVAGTPSASYLYRGTRGFLGPAESTDLSGLIEGDRIDLFIDSASTTPIYTYIVGSGGRIRTIDFDGTQWTPR